jgi:hypothetical protein
MRLALAEEDVEALRERQQFDSSYSPAQGPRTAQYCTKCRRLHVMTPPVCPRQGVGA